MTRLIITPRLALHNRVDRRVSNTVHAGQLHAVVIAGRELFADASHISAIQTSSTRHFATSMTALCHRISSVVSRCSEKQMIWPNARRIVAVMADKQTLRDGAIVQLPRVAMGKHVSSGYARSCNPSVPTKLLPCPYPTAVGLFDVAPESFFHCQINGAVPHDQLASMGTIVAGRVFETALEDVERRAAVDTCSQNGAGAVRIRAHRGLLSRVWGAMLRAVDAAPGLSTASYFTICKPKVSLLGGIS